MLNSDERDAILRLGELLKARTGISLGGLRDELVVGRLRRRMIQIGVASIVEYVHRIEHDRGDELQQFINRMTTNHTYFFREQSHLDFFASVFLKRFFESNRPDLQIWCAACSTGEEVYTLAMIARHFLLATGIGRQVSILGTDINTEALRIAANGVYPRRRLDSIPIKFRRKYFKQGRVPNEDYFRISDELRAMAKFVPGNLINPLNMYRSFDLIFCRNVMIYFDRSTIRRVLSFLCKNLKNNGVLVTGLSENVGAYDMRLRGIGPSVFTLSDPSPYAYNRLDCTPLGGLEEKSGIHVFDKVKAGQKDKTSSVVVPRNRGVVLKRPPPPVQASYRRRAVKDIREIDRTRTSGLSRIPIVVAIGASTGGQEAIIQVLNDMPKDFPPVVIAQHIAAGFSKGLAEVLNRSTNLDVQEARSGEMIEWGRVYVAPASQHLFVRQREGKLITVVQSLARKMTFVPSVDLLFASLSELRYTKVIATVLTGMGKDGAVGALKLRERGHWVIAQDRESSFVYGMPAAVVEAGAASIQLPLRAIGGCIIQRVKQLRDHSLKAA